MGGVCGDERVTGQVLLATDGSEDAALATRAAVELSKKGGSELHLVHVWRDVPSPTPRRVYSGDMQVPGEG